MDVIGNENVFILCMDGACVKTLRLFEEKYQKKFGQRCATHGASLLHLDIGKAFLEEIVIVKDVLKFIINHGYVLDSFKKTGAKSLHEVAGTRFASVVYSVVSVVNEKANIEMLWVQPAMTAWLQNQTAELKFEYQRLRDTLVRSDRMWKDLAFFVKLQTPLRVFLRSTDGIHPNLHLLAFEFQKAKIDTLAVVKKAFDDEELILDANNTFNKYRDMDTVINAKFNKREKDCVSDLAVAASMFCPHMIYDPKYANFSPIRGDLCARKAIQKYFGTDSEDPVIRAISADLIFQVKMHYAHYRQPVVGQYFARPEIVRSGAIYDNGNNWWTAVGEEYSDLAELARKLNNSFGGQGASERWNKEVTFTRTKSRNRQSHEVTSAYLQIKSNYRFKNAKNTGNDQSLQHEALRMEFAAVEAAQRMDMPEEIIAVDLALEIEGEADIRAEEDDDYDVNDDDAEDNFLINNVFAAEALLLLNRM